VTPVARLAGRGEEKGKGGEKEKKPNEIGIYKKSARHSLWTRQEKERGKEEGEKNESTTRRRRVRSRSVDRGEKKGGRKKKPRRTLLKIFAHGCTTREREKDKKKKKKKKKKTQEYGEITLHKRMPGASAKGKTAKKEKKKGGGDLLSPIQFRSTDEQEKEKRRKRGDILVAAVLAKAALFGEQRKMKKKNGARRHSPMATIHGAFVDIRKKKKRQKRERVLPITPFTNPQKLGVIDTAADKEEKKGEERASAKYLDGKRRRED